MSWDDGSGCKEEPSRCSPKHGVPVETDGGRITPDVILTCLRSSRRRFILYYLQDHERATVDELARQVAAWEDGVPPAEVATDHQKRVKTALVHTHLPMLADEVVIEYDPRSNEVKYTDPPALLNEVLRLLAKFETGSNE